MSICEISLGEKIAKTRVDSDRGIEGRRGFFWPQKHFVEAEVGGGGG